MAEQFVDHIATVYESEDGRVSVEVVDQEQMQSNHQFEGFRPNGIDLFITVDDELFKHKHVGRRLLEYYPFPGYEKRAKRATRKIVELAMKVEQV